MIIESNQQFVDEFQKVLVDVKNARMSTVFNSLDEVLSSGKSVYEVSGMEQRAVIDILGKDKCICGTTLSDEMRVNLKEMQATLPPESFESMLKSEVADSIDLDEEEKANISLRIDYGKTKSKISRLEREIAQISEQIQAIGAEEVVSVELKLGNSHEREIKYSTEVAGLEGEIKALSNQLKGKKDELNKKLDKIEKQDINKDVKNVLDQSAEFLRHRIKKKKGKIQEQLEDRINNNIKHLMRDKVRITLNSNLTPKVNFEAGATSVSSGQNVMISLAYLLGLMQIARAQTGDEIIKREISYPIVMDDVTAKLDNNHTHTMVENILKAETQIILLANDQMLVKLESSIIELSSLDSIESKLTKLRRDKDTNVTYKVVK